MTGPVLLALGMSLFAVSVRFPVPGFGFLTVSITDLTVTLTLLSAFRWRRLTMRSPIVGATVCLALAAVISGVVNQMTDRDFAAGNFAANFIRVLGLVAMVLLLPRVLSRFGHDRLAVAALWVVRMHCVLLLLDVVLALPLTWTEHGVVLDFGAADAKRPSGLFGEPSYFAVYMSLALFYILQVERNLEKRLFSAFDVMLVGLAIMMSTALTAVGVLVLFLLALVSRARARNRARLLGGLAVTSILLAALFSMQGTRFGASYQYLAERVGSLRQDFSLEETGQFGNDSSVRRLIGNPLFAYEALQDRPWAGSGLGGRNVERALERYVQYDPFRVANLSLTMMPVAVIVSLGLIGLAPWLYVVGSILRSRHTRSIGVGLCGAALVWGGAFAPLFWWHICLAISVAAVIPLSARRVSRRPVLQPRTV